MGQIHPDHVSVPQAALFYDGTFYLPARVDSKGRVRVRGEDQLFSFRSTLLKTRQWPISGDDGYCNSDEVPAGEVWVVTSVSGVDMTTPTTEVLMTILRGETLYYFHTDNAYKHAGQAWTVQCEKHLTEDDLVQVYFSGGLAGDDCWVTLTGHIMTLEG